MSKIIVKWNIDYSRKKWNGSFDSGWGYNQCPPLNSIWLCRNAASLLRCIILIKCASTVTMASGFIAYYYEQPTNNVAIFLLSSLSYSLLSILLNVFPILISSAPWIFFTHIIFFTLTTSLSSFTYCELNLIYSYQLISLAIIIIIIFPFMNNFPLLLFALAL